MSLKYIPSKPTNDVQTKTSILDNILVDITTDIDDFDTQNPLINASSCSTNCDSGASSSCGCGNCDGGASSC